ncbi:MAG: GNAT family N-acetyltransferase [Fimbriimonadaceae bacterium]
MKITYREFTSDLAASSLDGFCEGWAKPLSGEQLHTVFSSSYVVFLALDSEGSVLGFVQAISDGVLSAYIPLLEVRPNVQRQGIGRELMRLALDRLSALYMVDLCCDMELTDYYTKIGMVPVRGMCKRNFDCAMFDQLK